MKTAYGQNGLNPYAASVVTWQKGKRKSSFCPNRNPADDCKKTRPPEILLPGFGSLNIAGFIVMSSWITAKTGSPSGRKYPFRRSLFPR
ncbi:MAG: hypothetical protein KDC61_05480, partial [Saprospiraceae bacterium]|nr:hypothetical protein [Saprospiraceae bacterium]